MSGVNQKKKPITLDAFMGVISYNNSKHIRLIQELQSTVEGLKNSNIDRFDVLFGKIAALEELLKPGDSDVNEPLGKSSARSISNGIMERTEQLVGISKSDLREIIQKENMAITSNFSVLLLSKACAMCIFVILCLLLVSVKLPPLKGVGFFGTIV